MICRASRLAVMGLVGGVGLLGVASSSWGQASDTYVRPGARVDPAAAEAPTPRTADGHPDFNGYWGIPPAPNAGAGGGDPDDPGDAADELFGGAQLRNGDFANVTNDNWLSAQSVDDIPLYKPQYWAQVAQADRSSGTSDPQISCMPSLVPRLSVPIRIVEIPNEFLFWQAVPFQPNSFRDIPVGPPAYPPDPDGSWQGDPAAHWQGDTLVVETIGYNGQSFIGPAGYIHGYNLKTIERLQRQGNVLTYQVTVEDPDYLQQPWVLPPQRVQLIKGHPYEEIPPCVDRDVAHIVRPNQG